MLPQYIALPFSEHHPFVNLSVILFCKWGRMERGRDGGLIKEEQGGRGGGCIIKAKVITVEEGCEKWKQCLYIWGVAHRCPRFSMIRGRGNFWKGNYWKGNIGNLQYISKENFWIFFFEKLWLRVFFSKWCFKLDLNLANYLIESYRQTVNFMNLVV